MDPVEIFIYDCVVGEDAGSIIQQIRAAGAAPIDVRLNSPGGDVFAGYAIYNALLLHAPGVTVYVDGLAASIASYIAMAGRKIFMAENAMMMIHNPTTFIGGGADELRRSAELLDRCAASITDAYERRTKLPRARIVTMMEDETWLTPDMAKQLGFIDGITASLQAVARFDISKFRNPPKAQLNMNPFKAIITLLIAAMPGCITDSADAAAVETQVRALITSRDGFREKVTNFAKGVVAALQTALPALTLTAESPQADIEAGVTALATDRNTIKAQVVALTKSIVASLAAALPGKITLTDASTLAEIEAGLKLLVGDRDGLTLQVTNLTTERDRSKKHVGLLEVFAKSHHLDVSGIDPDRAATAPAAPVVKKSAKDFDDRIRAAGKDVLAVAAITKEFEAAVAAGTIS